MFHVPVIDSNQVPLMPTTILRAKRWVKSGKATPFWKKGVFCVRLNAEPSDRKTQRIAVGVDPGSKKEGYTIKSTAHTYLNIQADAVTWVKDAIETRRMMRRSRRQRKTPCRLRRIHRSHRGIPASTKSRWGWKLRLLNWMRKMFPITDVIVEDISAISKKGCRRWNQSFSPIMIGKNWFYDEVRKLSVLTLQKGYTTKNQRDILGLKKTSAKMSNKFEAHCVDSWVMSRAIVGGNDFPENNRILFVIPIQFRRRKLHLLQPSKGGKRRRDGGTISHGFKKGSLVHHRSLGLCYVGGSLENGVSLHGLSDGKRVTRRAKPSDIEFLSFSGWRFFKSSPNKHRHGPRNIFDPEKT